jgi:O-antigen/teichoic acid export membrane protein
MKSDSLTKQAAFLMAGRLLAMPLNFLVPIILVRVFTIEEFGLYKQLFMIFYIVLPVIDMGISQSLLYFLPKYSESRDDILSQTFLFQIPIFMGLTAVFFVFKNQIGMIFSENGNTLALYIPMLGIFALLWHLSNILENLLIAEKKAFEAGAVTFFSEALRAVVTIFIGAAGGGLEHLMYGLVGTSVVRCGAMGWYLKRTTHFTLDIKGSMIFSQLAYSLPFGFAVIVNTFVLFSHQYIVSISTGPTEFAIYAVGCFSLPIIAIVLDSVAKTSLVRMSAATAQPDSSEIIADIIYNSIRKLWILFFPVFVLLFMLSEEFIILMFTESYRDSIPVFRIFILIIPLSALLFQHVPRALDQTRFILKSNLTALALSVVFCFAFYRIAGLSGAAGGFIAANLIWRLLFLFKCRKTLQMPLNHILPLGSMIKVSVSILVIGTVVFLIKKILFTSLIPAFIFSVLIFGVSCLLVYWFGSFLLDSEKQIVKKWAHSYIDFDHRKKLS